MIVNSSKTFGENILHELKPFKFDIFKSIPSDACHFRYYG